MLANSTDNAEWGDDYETKDRDTRLRILTEQYQKATGDFVRFFEGRLIELTIFMAECPEWYNRLNLPCACRECCSNG